MVIVVTTGMHSNRYLDGMLTRHPAYPTPSLTFVTRTNKDQESPKALPRQPSRLLRLTSSGACRRRKDPLAYDRLIRRFQSAAEREVDGKKKGYSGVLEADLWRSEAKIEAFSSNGKDGQELSYARNANGEIVAEEKDEAPASKEDGERRWRKQVELRFLRGDDPDFDYRTVDENDQFDAPEEARDIQDQWFEEEEERSSPGPGLAGQTGIQDF
ncbi:MAG: hypothetical protein LQ337_003898 [Flavoplaca oasis]|nr:MAG: hypothetical protein LQ337_003898 [Flavoplaca oasis]